MRLSDVFSLVLVLSAVLTPAGAEPGSTAAAPSEQFRTALEQARQGIQVDKRLHAIWDVGSSLTPTDFPGALEAINDLKELRERIVFQEAALKRWSEVAPQDAFPHVASLPESQVKLNILREVAANFARKDPAAAATAAAAMKPSASRNDALETIAHFWAQSNAGAAHQWAQELPNDFAKEAVLNAIRYIWVHSDPVAAAKHIEKLPEGQNRNNLISNLAYEWTTRDVPGAIQWARSLPAGADQDEAFAKIAESWADHDANSAAAFSLGLPPGEARLAAATLTVSRWARQDPLAAAQWSWKNADADVRARGTAAALEVWAPVDPVAAGKWLSELPAGPQRDQLILGYVDVTVMWAPQVVAKQALLIAEPKARARAVEQCLSRWREVDADAANQWIHATEHASASATPPLQAAPGS